MNLANFSKNFEMQYPKYSRVSTFHYHVTSPANLSLQHTMRFFVLYWLLSLLNAAI